MRKLLACLPFTLILSGCSTLTNLAPIGPGTAARNTISGRVHGGQQAVAGSVIQLYAVGTTGYGSAPTGLISSLNQAIAGKALTDALGNFNLAGTFTCPTGATQVYLTATGGNPGLTAGTNNSALVLMAPVGRCDSLGAGSFLNIDEVSTIAAVYPLAQFMDPATGNVGSYSSSTNGLLNAFVIAPQLYNASTGLAVDTVPNGTASVPQSEIHTLANIIAPCVNSAGPTSTACAALFSATNPPGSTTTLTAALAIALHPGSNVANIFSLSNAAAPFQPSLSSAPNDFTVSLNINSGASYPVGLAIDSAGNAWIADTSTGGAAGRLVKINANGIPATGSPYSAGTNSATGIAIDTSGSIWITNHDTNSVTKFLQSGAVQGGPFTVGTGPSAIAFDTVGRGWVANTTDGNGTVSVINSSGVAQTPALSPSGIHVPVSVAIDQSGNAWISSNSGASIEEINSSYATVSPTGGYTGGGMVGARSLSVDASSNIWAANSSANVISEFANSGAPISAAGFSGAGIASSTTLAIDGGGNIWTASQNNNYLSELNSVGTLITPSTGYKTVAMSQPLALAIDASGNVWVSSANKTFVPNFAFQSNLAVFLGVASPTVTPIAQALKTGFIGVRPGTPVPVSVLTTEVPVFTTNSPYAVQLQASGGSGSYTWTLVSGSLPNGLTLSSGGLIASQSSATTATSAVIRAADSTDSSNFANVSLTFTPSTQLGGNPRAGYLSGKYALRFSGYKVGTPSTSGTVSGVAWIGSFSFDGNGNVTGTYDLNRVGTGLSNSAVTGTYVIGVDQRGTMVLQNASGESTEYDFAVSNLNAGIASQINFAEHDYTGAANTQYSLGSGIGKLQNANFFTGTIAQNFAFGMDGETPCTTCNGTVSPFGPVSLAGQLTNSGGTITGRADGGAQDTSYNVTLSGTYTAGNASTGRGTLTLTPTGTFFPAAPSNFVYYVVDNTEIFLLSTDSHSTNTLLTGDALTQSGTFSNSTLTGSYVSSETFSNNAGGASNYPVDSAVGISNFTVSTSSPGNFTVLSDKINQGVVTIENTNGGALFPFSMDSTGRLTLFSGAAGIPVFYFANANSGFGSEQPTSGHTPGLFTVLHQTPASYSCASLANSSNYAVGSFHPPTMIPVATGVFTIFSNTVGATIDISNNNGALSTGTSFTYNCATDSLTAASGRLTLTIGNSTSVMYVISPTSAVVMDATSGSISPGLYYIQR